MNAEENMVKSFSCNYYFICNIVQFTLKHNIAIFYFNHIIFNWIQFQNQIKYM